MHSRDFVFRQPGQNRVYLRFLTLFTALCLAALFCSFSRAQDEAHTGDGMHPILKIGSAAPAFSLPGVDGKMHSIGDFASAKVLVVVFSCNHCPVAQMYEKRIKQLVTDYSSRGVAVVVIMGNDPGAERPSELGYTDVGDTFADMKIRAKYRNFNFPYLYDGETEKVALAYGPTATPHAFIFDQKRMLRYEGRIDSNAREALATKHEARDAIEALLAGKPVTVTDTPAVGCSTKWSSKSNSVQQEIAKFNQQPVTLDMVSADQLKALRKNAGSDKLLLVNVWATWCGPCVAEFPDLQEMVRMYQQRQLEIVTVSINNPDEKDRVLAFLQKQHAISKNLLFSGNDSADAVSAFGTGWTGGAPYTVLIGMNGEILYKEQGDMNILNVRRAIVKNVPDDNFVGQHAYWNSTF